MLKVKNEELNRTKNELYEKKKLDDIDKLKEVQEKFDSQIYNVKELKSELDKKKKNIKALEDNSQYLKNEKFEMKDEKNKLEKINNTNNQEIQKLEEKIEEDKNYFNNYEENRIELEKKIKELKILNDSLIKEIKEINEKLNNKEKLNNEYEKELYALNYEYKQKIEELTEELNNRGISINKLNKINNKYEQKIEELKEELNNKEISLNEYKKRLAESDDIRKQEIEKLRKEFKKSDMKKIAELNELNSKYKKELSIKKEELTNSKKEINDLKNQKQLLIQESNNLKNEIKELKKVKKSDTPTKIHQSVRKKDDKYRTFAPKDFQKDILPKYNEKSNRLKNLEEEYQNITEEKNIFNPNKIPNIKKDDFIDPATLEKLNLKYIEKIMKNSEFYEYELSISDSRIEYFDKIIKENPEMSAKDIDIINQLKTLYTIRREYFKVKINDPKSKKANLRSLDDKIRK